MPTWIEEGKWKCTSCEHINPGRSKVCENCGSPKDESEPDFFDRPASPENAVADPALQQQFRAGPDWECKYCGGKQRRDDGACANCGSSQDVSEGREKARAVEEEPKSASTRQPPASLSKAPPRQRSQPLPRRAQAYAAGQDELAKGIASVEREHKITLALIVISISAALIALMYVLFHTTEKEVTVESVNWEHVVAVERYKLVHEEGFDEDQPLDAINVHSLGSRHHHYRKYQCGTQEESYEVREECGEDCSTTPVRCRDLKNGSRECSGGDRVCKTKYCSRTKYRTVAKYCNESITEIYYAWDVWRWKHQRNVTTQGLTVDSPRWPSEQELQLGVGCVGEEKERTGARTATYKVVFKDREGEKYDYTAKTLPDFQKLPVGSTHRWKYSIAMGIQPPGRSEAVYVNRP